MKTAYYNDTSDTLLKNISSGAFLTVSNGAKTNAMTIGWGGINHIWQQPICMVMVRPVRYTWELIEKTGEFAVSVPTAGQLKAELGICGSKSGRTIDKVAVCKLDLLDAKFIAPKLIANCNLYYECKVIGKQALTAATMDPQHDQQWYPAKDYHIVYFGQILATYQQ